MANGCSVTDGQQEDDRQAGEEDRQGDLVRRLLPVGALDEGDHAVEERLARLGRDAHDDLVGQHPRAAGDGGAVAAGLADDRRRLAGDRRLVDGGDALDDVAVAGDHLAAPTRRTGRRSAAARTAPRRLRRPSRRTRATVSLRVLRSVAAWALPRPSAIASAKLANSTVNQRKTHDEAGEQVLLAGRVAEVADEEDRRQHRADLDDEHHRVAGERPRVELDEGVEHGALDDRRRRTATGPRRPAAHLRGAVRRGRDRCRFGSDGGGHEPGDLTCDRCSTIGPSARAGKNVRPATMTIAPATRPPNSGESVGNVPAVTGTRLLAHERAADGQRRDDQEEAADQHREALGHRVPVGAGALAGERRAVVVGRRGVVVEHLRQAVRPRVEDRRRRRVEHDRRRRRSRAGRPAWRSGTARRASSRGPGSSCRGTPACARPSGRR